MGGACSRKRSSSVQFLTTDEASLVSEMDREAIQKRTCKKTTRWSVVVLFLCMLVAFIAIWVCVPVSFMLSLPFQTFMVFVPIDSPRNADFDRPEDFGLQGVLNFHISTQDYYENNTWTSIGAWLLLPEDDINSTSSRNVTEILQNTDRDIVIYLHGVLANRAKALEQYRVIRRHFLILAIDHRGYGDSGQNVRMGEEGIANDHLQIFDWVKSINSKNDIYYWGHSLGSAISARTLKLMSEQRSMAPTGLILESPFTTLEDVVSNMIVGKVFSWLAYFEATVLRPLDRNGFHFRSRDNIQSIDCPVMILHAEDDMIVPYILGEALAEAAKETRESHQGKVVFHGISTDFGFGHNDIVQHPQINTIIQDFKTICRNFSSSS